MRKLEKYCTLASQSGNTRVDKTARALVEVRKVPKMWNKPLES
jgi:hypothetical protein